MRALEKSVEQCRFADAVLFCDVPVNSSLAVRVEWIPKIRSIAEYNRFILKELADRVETDFVLIVQWDGYVVDGSQWRDGFRDYDYIGARWPFDYGPMVGNGGFSLRSRRLLKAVQGLAAEYTGSVAEDLFVCDVLGPSLHRNSGINFAPPELADYFSDESAGGGKRTFGFHGLFNFPEYVNPGELRGIAAELPDMVFQKPEFYVLVDRYIQKKEFVALREIRIGARGRFTPEFLFWRILSNASDRESAMSVLNFVFRTSQRQMKIDQ